MSDRSRHARYSRYHHPRDKRVRCLYGEKTDASRWYTCWNCGFIVDANRTASGGRGSGIDYNASTEMGYFPVDYDLSLAMGDGGGFCLMELNSDGSEKEIYTDFASDSGSGCPLCGTLNWR